MNSSWVALARARSGLLNVDQLAACGVSAQVVARRVRQGLWWKPLPRVVCTAARHELDRGRRRAAALLWLPRCALISHFDAAALWGLSVGLPRDVHASIDRRHNPRPQPGFVVHRVDTLADLDRASRGGVAVTAFERTVVDTFEVMHLRRHRRGLVAEVFRDRRTTEARLLAAVARVPKLRRRDELLATVTEAAGGSHSGNEMDHWEWLAACGFGRPERQFPVLVNGVVRWLDGCDPELRIRYEVDGPAHDDDEQRELDEATDLALTADGWVTVRLRSPRTRRAPQVVADELTRLRAHRRRLANAGLLLPAIRAHVG